MCIRDSWYLKRDLIINADLFGTTLFIMRIIPPENDGFALVLLDFSFLNEPLFLYPDTLQQGLSRLVRQVLGLSLIHI